MHRLSFCLLAAALAASAQPGQPAPPAPSRLRGPAGQAAVLPAQLQGVGIDQKLNNPVPLDLVFRDEYGRSVPLGTYFGSKPVLLALVYYQCPMLCTQILTGLETSLKAVSFNPGRDFEVVAVSIDPSEGPELALHKKNNYVHRYGRPNTANGWHFLTGDKPAIKALADAAGFRYKYDPATKQFAHASAIFILTPDGRMSRYFYGVEYSPRDIRLGLVEASQNKIGSPVDQILLFCYHYDPGTGKYSALALQSLRVFAAMFALIGGSFLFLMWRREGRAARRHSKV